MWNAKLTQPQWFAISGQSFYGRKNQGVPRLRLTHVQTDTPATVREGRRPDPEG